MNEYLLAQVVTVYSPELFFINYGTKHDFDEYKEFTNYIDLICKDESVVEQVHLNQNYLLVMSYNKVFRKYGRCIIIGEKKQFISTEATLYFIDYGNLQEVRHEEILIINNSEIFRNVILHPISIMPCTLGIEPIFGKWSFELIQKFIKIIMDCKNLFQLSIIQMISTTSKNLSYVILKPFNDIFTITEKLINEQLGKETDISFMLKPNSCNFFTQFYDCFAISESSKTLNTCQPALCDKIDTLNGSSMIYEKNNEKPTKHINNNNALKISVANVPSCLKFYKMYTIEELKGYKIFRSEIKPDILKRMNALGINTNKISSPEFIEKYSKPQKVSISLSDAEDLNKPVLEQMVCTNAGTTIIAGTVKNQLTKSGQLDVTSKIMVSMEELPYKNEPDKFRSIFDQLQSDDNSLVYHGDNILNKTDLAFKVTQNKNFPTRESSLRGYCPPRSICITKTDPGNGLKSPRAVNINKLPLPKKIQQHLVGWNFLHKFSRILSSSQSSFDSSHDSDVDDNVVEDTIVDAENSSQRNAQPESVIINTIDTNKSNNFILNQSGSNINKSALLEINKRTSAKTSKGAAVTKPRPLMEVDNFAPIIKPIKNGTAAKTKRVKRKSDKMSLAPDGTLLNHPLTLKNVPNLFKIPKPSFKTLINKDNNIIKYGHLDFCNLNHVSNYNIPKSLGPASPPVQNLRQGECVLNAMNQPPEKSSIPHPDSIFKTPKPNYISQTHGKDNKIRDNDSKAAFNSNLPIHNKSVHKIPLQDVLFDNYNSTPKTTTLSPTIRKIGKQEAKKHLGSLFASPNSNKSALTHGKSIKTHFTSTLEAQQKLKDVPNLNGSATLNNNLINRMFLKPMKHKSPVYGKAIHPFEPQKSCDYGRKMNFNDFFF